MTEPSANKNKNPTEKFPRSLKNPTGQCETGLDFILCLVFFMERRGKILSKECRGFVVTAGTTSFPNLQGRFKSSCKQQMCRRIAPCFSSVLLRGQILTWHGQGRNGWVSVYWSTSTQSYHELQIILLSTIPDLGSRAIQLRTETQWLGCTGNHNDSTSTLNRLGLGHRLKKHRL